MRKNIKLPTIIGIFVLLLGLGAGIYLLNVQTFFRLRASPDTEPQDVRITNISDSSFTVSWTTTKETVGFVVYGQGTQTNQNAPDPDADAKNLHTIDVAGLTANTDYSFKINSDGSVKDNNGIAWKVKTGPVLQTNGVQRTASGTVTDSSGNPVANALVYINTQGSSPLSTQASANGTWVMPLNRFRTSNLTSQAQLTDQSLLEIFVQAGPRGIATAQIYLASSNPVPPMIIGQTHDFRNEKVNNSDTTPTSDLTLPETATESSKFNIGDNTAGGTETVTLESLDPGETVTTTTPEFFGEGPANTQISITVNSSHEFKDTVTVGADGEWSWSVPDDLEPGPHTITLSWRDAQGILRTLTRSFVVEAKDGPAFESTPSATPRGTATPRPSGAPKASPTSSPKTIMPATDSGTPVAGNGTPTLILLASGATFIVAGLIIAKKSFEI